MIRILTGACALALTTAAHAAPVSASFEADYPNGFSITSVNEVKMAISYDPDNLVTTPFGGSNAFVVDGKLSVDGQDAKLFETLLFLSTDIFGRRTFANIIFNLQDPDTVGVSPDRRVFDGENDGITLGNSTLDLNEVRIGLSELDFNVPLFDKSNPVPTEDVTFAAEGYVNGMRMSLFNPGRLFASGSNYGVFGENYDANSTPFAINIGTGASAVPLPAAAPFFLAGMAAFSAARRLRKA